LIGALVERIPLALQQTGKLMSSTGILVDWANLGIGPPIDYLNFGNRRMQGVVL
jgi:hypothetical protein